MPFTSCAGCAFIKYSQRDHAQAAINALNGVYVMQVRSLCHEPVLRTLLMETILLGQMLVSSFCFEVMWF